MVMPCGLTPVEGIDFVDWFYFSMYACAHVWPTQTNTHRPMYSTVPLKSGRLLNLNISQWRALPSPKRQFVHVQRTLLKEGRGTSARLPSPRKQDGESFNLSWLVTGWTHRDSWRVFIAINNHIHSSRRSWRHKSMGAISWMQKGNIKTFHSTTTSWF